MTVEEAAEEVLLGAYMGCPFCESHGTDGVVMNSCTTCETWGRVIRAHYMEACVVLGLPPPLDHTYIPVYPRDQREPSKKIAP